MSGILDTRTPTYCNSVFDQVVRESEEETLMNEVTAKLTVYQICISFNNEECSRRRLIGQSGEEVRERDTYPFAFPVF